MHNKYHLPSCCGSAGIWYSTCLEIPRIAKFRTYFCKKFLGEDPKSAPDPTFNTTFSFFLFCGPLPTFRRQGTPLIYTNILQIWMIPHIITFFELISVQFENQHQTLNIKKMTGAKLGFASIYLRIDVKLLDFQGGGGELTLSLLSRGFRKLPICFIFSSYRSIYDNKKVDKAFVYL